MKILHVARYGSVQGGAEAYIQALATGQRAAGHEVALLYGLDPDLTRPEVAAGEQLDALIEPSTNPLAHESFPLREAVRARAPDLIHVHVPDITWVAPLLHLHAPTLLAVHDHRVSCPTATRYWKYRDAHCDVQPGLKCLFHNVVSGCGSMRANATLKPHSLWLGARSAARDRSIQVFSRYMHGQVARMGVPRDDIHVTPYPVPPAVAPVALNEDADALPVVYASGRLNHEKGFMHLLNSLAEVETPVHLVIAGDGYLAEALRATPVGKHRVTFLGWVGPDVAAAWRRRADVVAVPSAWPEPFGIVGIEAMADAKPVVAFAGGGIGEWLVDGVTGIEVPQGDVRAFGAALQALISDPEAGAAMGAAGRERAETLFGLEKHVSRLDAVYQRIVDLWAPLR